MKTIAIPKEFTKEKELVIVSRREYEKLLKQFWQSPSADNFLKMYDDSRDSIYDRL